ncbi:MAG: LemA family protein [Actinomycetota bacterium]
MVAVIVILVVVVLAVVVFAGLYNGLVTRRNRVDQAWSDIGVQLERRHDLIPNLVETVKGYAAHERQTFESVVAARNAAVNAQQTSGPADLARAEDALSGALGRLFALAEAYPDLKANANFLALQEELTATEGRIAYARQFYNDSVQRYQTAIQTFPRNLIAGMFGFGPREWFRADEGASAVPRVEF